jgi:hypothetical protein
MAVQAWTDVLIAVNDLNISGFGKSFSLDMQAAPLDTTSLATTGYTSSIAGLKSGSFSMDLMADFAEDSVDEVAFAALGASNTVKSIVIGSADGSKAYLSSGVVANYTAISGNVGELAMSNLSAQTSGVIARGKLLHPTTARTSSSTGTGRQLGAVAAGKRMYAALHVFTVSGTSPTLDVIVQSDDNAGFTTPTSRITFSQANATTNRAQFSSVAGAITDDYWRVSWTIGGSSTPTFAFIVTAGIL